MNQNQETKRLAPRMRTGRPPKRGTKLAALRVMALAMAGTFGLSACPTPQDAVDEAPRVDLERFFVEVRDDDIALGGEDPLVTIVVFSDYACGPCGKTWKVMEHLHEHYGDDLRVVYRAASVPGLKHGDQASEAAFAADAQGKFWPMHWALFAAGGDFSRPTLQQKAEAAGLDVPKFIDDIDGGAYSGRRARDHRHATVLGLQGALPVTFVNGLFLLGFKNEEGMRGLIDAEIENARKMMRAGTDRKDLYAEFMKTAAREQGVLRDKVAGDVDAQALRDQMKDVKAATDPRKLNRADPALRYDVPSGQGAPSTGPEDAPVVVVEFTDYQCPFCRKAHEEIVPAIVEAHGDDVRVEMRMLPLEMHPGAEPGARAALAAARQGKFWAFHDAMLEKELEFSRSAFVDHAKSLSMDVERFEKDLDDEDIRKAISADKELARSLGVLATPGFFINGRHVSGARTPATFTSIIEEELAKAAQLEQGGTARADLHAALMADAIGPKQFPNAPGGGSAAPQPSNQQRPDAGEGATP